MNYKGKRDLAILLYLGLIFLSSCKDLSDQYSLRPDQLEKQKVVRLTNGLLNVVFVDNCAFGEQHRAGYNGIAELTHRSQDSSVFVPDYAGFNLEHIFGGDSLTELFEPRKHPMELFSKSDKEVVLYQSPTPLSSVESQTVFRLTDTHYIDISFRFIVHDRKFFRHGYAGLFWASYIHAPVDRKIYFLGFEGDENSPHWISAYSSMHGLKSTHVVKNEQKPVYFASNFNASLASHFSDYTFDQAFYYGRFHNMVLAYMFRSDSGIRFSQSPTGGGDRNPAWDFQFIVPDFKVGQEYSFQARLLYKEFAGATDVLEEYRLWLSKFKS